MKELDVIKFINSLKEKEFSELFYKAIEHRRKYKEFADGFEIETYCIVQSSFGKFENSLDSWRRLVQNEVMPNNDDN